MLIDANDIPSGSRLQTDLCVIGAGAAGITVAREFAGSSTDVVVLESGGFEPDERTQALYEGDVVGEPLVSHFDEVDLVQTRLRYFGGTTNHWAGYCRPLDPADFEPRPYLDTPGWPFPRSELEPWWDRAAEVIQLVSTSFSWAAWASRDDIGEPLVETDTVDSILFQVKFPFSFGTAYRDLLETASNVRVATWANVVELVSAAPTAPVESALVKTLEGNEFAVDAAAFVVATGGIETPRLLLSSTAGQPEGLGNENDLVGRYFAEHLQVPVGFALLRPPTSEMAPYQGLDVVHDTDPNRTVGLRAAFSRSAAAVLGAEQLGLEVQLGPAPLQPGEPSYDDGVRTDDVAALLAAEWGRPPGTAAYVLALGEQAPNRDSRVVLTDETDELGMPRVALDWRRVDLDRISIVDGLDQVAAALGATDTGRLQVVPGSIGQIPEIPEGASPIGVYLVDATTVDLDDFPVGTGFHHMGTMRMADDATEGVVDAQCRVHTVDNLYIAGSSVFPVSGTATPTFTIVALALRLAEHLRTDVLS